MSFSYLFTGLYPLFSSVSLLVGSLRTNRHEDSFFLIGRVPFIEDQRWSLFF